MEAKTEERHKNSTNKNNNKLNIKCLTIPACFASSPFLWSQLQNKLHSKVFWLRHTPSSDPMTHDFIKEFKIPLPIILEVVSNRACRRSRSLSHEIVENS